MKLLQRLGRGATAGAVGVAVLDAVTHLDMAVRGRPASSVPARTADELARRANIPLDQQYESGQPGGARGSDPADARREGTGALLGHLTGFAIGAAYGLLRPGPLKRLPRPLAAIVIGVAATTATSLTYRSLGVSDPASWSGEEWAADVVPHLCFGLATALAFDALDDGRHDSLLHRAVHAIPNALPAAVPAAIAAATAAGQDVRPADLARRVVEHTPGVRRLS